MRCALVNVSTNVVENMVVADPAVDAAPDGFLLIDVGDDDLVGVGWAYASGQFFARPEPIDAPPDGGGH